MGIVYLARQVSLDRLVALKVLGQSLSRPSDKARFQREAQAVAKLKHPNIATVHFVGQDDRLCYMAMEYIDGVSLREVIDRLSRTTNPDSSVDDFLEFAESDPGIERFAIVDTISRLVSFIGLLLGSWFVWLPSTHQLQTVRPAPHRGRKFLEVFLSAGKFSIS